MNDVQTPMIPPSDKGSLQRFEVDCVMFDIVNADNIDVSENKSDDDSVLTDLNTYLSLQNMNTDQNDCDNKTTEQDHEQKDDTKNEKEEEEPITIKGEMKKMSKIAFPVCLTSISRIVMWQTDTIFLGHLGDKQLAGAALADICMEILTLFVYSPTWSLNALCSQAVGSGNAWMAAYWLQITVSLCTLICIPAYVGYFYVWHLIAIFSDDDQVVYYAKEFCHYSALFLWTSAMCSTIRNYFQALEIVNPFTYISLFAIVMNIVSNQIFIHGLHIEFLGIDFNGWGFIGSPISTATSLSLQLIIYYLFCFVWKKYHIKHKAWKKWSMKESIGNCSRVKSFMKIVVPNTISDASENWAYQVIVLYAATLKAPEIAAMSCMFTIWGLLWAFTSGFGAATVTRVGKKIGANKVDEAKLVCKVALLLYLLVCTPIAIIICSLSYWIPLVYTNDPEVHSIMRQCIPLLSAIYIVGAVGWCASQILEAMSKNKSRGTVVVLTAWFGYLPGCLYFAFNHYQWVGLDPVSCIFIVGVVVEFVRSALLWVIIFKCDWEKCCKEAQERNEKFENEIAQQKDDKKNSQENNSEIDEKQHALLHEKKLQDLENQAATAV